jgi:hypothetical protein
MLSQAHRRSIHTSLTPVLGEEEADALMSEFPTSEHDMPATKADLNGLRHEMQVGFAEMRSEMHDLFRRMTTWLVGLIITAMIGGMGLAAWIGAAVGNGGSP